MGAFIITLRSLCNIDPSRSHFDTVKLGFSGVYIISVVYVFLAFMPLSLKKLVRHIAFGLCVRVSRFFMHPVILDRAC